MASGPDQPAQPAVQPGGPDISPQGSLQPDLDPNDPEGTAPELQEEDGGDRSTPNNLPTVLKKLQKWGDYAAFGTPVHPTRFIPMKTPLSNDILASWSLPQAPRHRLTVPELLAAQQQYGRRVGLILDLSNHDCLYTTDIPAGMRYTHIHLVAKELPPREFVDEVCAEARAFWSANPDDYIAIHCAYGFNRTGFVVCCYLIEVCGLSVEEALGAFAASRPPGVKHEAFRAELHARYASKSNMGAACIPNSFNSPVRNAHTRHTHPGSISPGALMPRSPFSSVSQGMPALSGGSRSMDAGSDAGNQGQSSTGSLASGSMLPSVSSATAQTPGCAGQSLAGGGGSEEADASSALAAAMCAGTAGASAAAAVIRQLETGMGLQTPVGAGGMGAFLGITPMSENDSLGVNDRAIMRVLSQAAAAQSASPVAQLADKLEAAATTTDLRSPAAAHTVPKPGLAAAAAQHPKLQRRSLGDVAWSSEPEGTEDDGPGLQQLQP